MSRSREHELGAAVHVGALLIAAALVLSPQINADDSGAFEGVYSELTEIYTLDSVGLVHQILTKVKERGHVYMDPARLQRV